MSARLQQTCQSTWVMPRAATALWDTARGYRLWWAAEGNSARGRLSSGPSNARHALIVAASLPPRFGGGVFRPTSWLRYGPDNGWRVSAVTRSLTESPTDAGRQLAATIADTVKIVHATPLALAPSHRLFARVDGGLIAALEVYFAAARDFADDPPSVVIGSGPSFNMFAAAFLLARRFGAKLVLDYRDEWTDNPFTAVNAGKLDLWWERRCLAAADAVLFTTESQRLRSAAIFAGMAEGKRHVLPNGWEPDPSRAAKPVNGDRRDTLDIAFSGGLGEHCLPGAFLRDCARVFESHAALRETVRLHFIGRRAPVADSELQAFRFADRLVLHGLQPKPYADAMIRGADALLLIATPDLARYIPGKLYEYLASDRPILIHGHPGEVTSIVSRLRAGLFVQEGKVADLAEAFSAFWSQPAANWSSPQRSAWTKSRTRERLARDLFELISDLATPCSTDRFSR